MRLRSLAWASISLFACACSDSGGDAPIDASVDASMAIDASVDASVDASIAADAAAAEDAAPSDAADPDWQSDHCLGRDCYYVMQNEPGADDLTCNGRAPIDLGTIDPSGLHDCPFAGLQGPARAILNPESGPSRKKTIFVGSGDYPVWPGLALHGDGASADEAVLFTTYRGQRAKLDGSCPASCTIDTPSGPVTRTPCCGRRCPTCDASPLCTPAIGFETQCVVPIERSEQLLTVWGSWVRVEGFELRGCWEDDIRVAWSDTGTPPQIVPNDHLYIVNNSIEGCDVNENIKGLRNGPGPLQGGPEWGPVHVIGNELYAMASQAVDATGVHRWLVEDNYLHDAKQGANQFVAFDGGGLGFKNGGSEIIVRNNWSAGGGGFGLGGASGSCIEDVDPPADWGCFQRYEMIDMLVENNVAIDPGAAFPDNSSSARGTGVYHCDNCRFFGNYLRGDIGIAGVMIDDECPGPRCPAYNPNLLPTHDFAFERNMIAGGVMLPNGAPLMFMYQRDSAPSGPAGNGMRSRDNLFCAASGFPAVADPEHEAQQFAHRDPGMAYALADYRAQIGDVGSAIFNAQDAPLAACPSGPLAFSVLPSDDSVTWIGPAGCADCACVILFDDAEQFVACSDTLALPAAARTPGRHYVALRVARAGGGASCGASYNVGAPVIGAACRIGVDAAAARAVWSSDGVTCRLLADGATDLGVVPCSGDRALDGALAETGRHQLRLRVEDAADGQTTCSIMYNR